MIPPDYDGSAESLQQLRINLMRSGTIGRMVATRMAVSKATQEVDEMSAGMSRGERLIADGFPEPRGDFSAQAVGFGGEYVRIDHPRPDRRLAPLAGETLEMVDMILESDVETVAMIKRDAVSGAALLAVIDWK